MLNTLKMLIRKTVGLVQLQQEMDELRLLSGALLAKQLRQRGAISSLSETEFKVFSQWGDDGIIQYLIQRLDIPHKTFIEFGVADYWESNTRFLLMNDNWSGLVMDGSEENITAIKEAYYYWRYDLEAVACFVDTNNINQLIANRGFDEEVGLLHIDIDGNDYWVWKAINVIRPVIVVVEYNSSFGSEREITVPYRRDFDRAKAHYSHLYFGTSLAALNHLAGEKQYRFVGCNSAGNNAYFVRADKLNPECTKLCESARYQASRFRESRNTAGELDYKQGGDRLEAIKGLPVYNVKTGQDEIL